MRRLWLACDERWWITHRRVHCRTPIWCENREKRCAANFSLPARCLKSRAKVLRYKEERANESTDINQRLQIIKEHPCCSFFADALVSKKISFASKLADYIIYFSSNIESGNRDWILYSKLAYSERLGMCMCVLLNSSFQSIIQLKLRMKFHGCFLMENPTASVCSRYQVDCIKCARATLRSLFGI